MHRIHITQRVNNTTTEVTYKGIFQYYDNKQNTWNFMTVSPTSLTADRIVVKWIKIGNPNTNIPLTVDDANIAMSTSPANFIPPSEITLFSELVTTLQLPKSIILGTVNAYDESYKTTQNNIKYYTDRIELTFDNETGQKSHTRIFLETCETVPYSVNKSPDKKTCILPGYWCIMGIVDYIAGDRYVFKSTTIKTEYKDHTTIVTFSDEQLDDAALLATQVDRWELSFSENKYDDIVPFEIPVRIVNDNTNQLTTLHTITDIGRTIFITTTPFNRYYILIPRWMVALRTNKIISTPNKSYLSTILSKYIQYGVHSHPNLLDLNLITVKKNMIYINNIPIISPEFQGQLANVADLLSTKADKDHTHPISDITTLQTVLDGKAAVNHTHTGYELMGTADAYMSAHLGTYNHADIALNTAFRESPHADPSAATNPTRVSPSELVLEAPITELRSWAPADVYSYIDKYGDDRWNIYNSSHMAGLITYKNLNHVQNITSTDPVVLTPDQNNARIIDISLSNDVMLAQNYDATHSNIVDAARSISDGVDIVTFSDILNAYEHSQINPGNPHGIDLDILGIPNVDNILNNFAAERDPTTSDDSYIGYSVGSRWINITINSIWECVDSTQGSAKWHQLDLGAVSNVMFTTVYDTNNNNIVDAAEALSDGVSINISAATVESAVNKAHDQNTDQYLDQGGANEVTAAQAKTGYNHSQITGSNIHALTPTLIGLGNVTNDAQIPLIQKGAVNGVAELDSNGTVPSAQLPSFVDDVLEYNTFADLPAAGAAGKIYVTLDDNHTYRWSGSAYVEISSSLALGTTSSTAYRGDYGQIAYNHSQLTGSNPHALTPALLGAADAVHTHEAAAVTSGIFDSARLPLVTDTTPGVVSATGTPSGKYYRDDKTWATPPGGGDMTISVYDTNANDIVDKAESIDDGATIQLTATQLNEAVTDMHVQNKDTYLDQGGANEVTAAQAKTGYTHSQTTGSNVHALTPTLIGLGNVTNDAQIPLTQKGAVNGVAELDATGKVPSAELPSFVDDVLEYGTYGDLPVTGESGKIYIALDTNITYRWSGTVYVEISSSLALGVTDSTAYRGDYGQIAYNHSQTTGSNVHALTPALIGAAPVTHEHAGTDITSGTIPGARLPDMSADNKGAVPPTGPPSGKVLQDDGTWVTPSASSANIGGLYGINVELLTGDKTLTAGTDVIYQHLNTNGADRIVTLDIPSASNGDRFIIKNITSTSNKIIIKNSDTYILEYIYANGFAMFIFDGAWHPATIDSLKNQLSIGYNTNANTYGLAIGDSASGHDYGIGIGRYAAGYSYGLALGYSANGYNHGIAIGYYADGHGSGVAIGESSNGTSLGTAIGYQSDGSNYGTAISYLSDGNTFGATIGNGSHGYNYGAALGYAAYGYDNGAAVGYAAHGYTYGVAIGYHADGYTYGVGIGSFSNGMTYGVSIGRSANGHSYGIAIGTESGGERNGVAIGAYAGSNSRAAFLDTDINKNIYMGYSAGKLVNPGKWSLTLTPNIDDLVEPVIANGYTYKCIVAGTPDSSEPTWPTTIGNTVVDGTVTWECIAKQGNNNLIIGYNLTGTAGQNNQLNIGDLLKGDLVDKRFTPDSSIEFKRTATAVDANSNASVIIGVTDTSVTRTITLLTADCLDGRSYIIKDESGGATTNNITIATEGSETIDGAASQVISTNYGTLRVYSDGTNWFIW